MRKNRKYLEYMDDGKLLAAIGQLFQSYRKAYAEKTLKELNKNILDPFKFQFDTVFLNGGDPEATLRNEILRQSDKTIANAVGLFHQQLIGSIDGFMETPSLPCDVKKEDDTVFAEIKNKFNTMNVRSAAGVYEELLSIAKANPQAMCYLVEIIARKSRDEEWTITVNEAVQRHKRIHVISADRFYALATGNPDAFAVLVEVLPRAIQEFLQKQGESGIFMAGGAKAKAYEEICDCAGSYGMAEDVVRQLYEIALPNYGKFLKQEKR